MRRVLVISIIAIVGILILAAGWTAWRAKTATSMASELTSTINTLRTDATSGNLDAVSKDITTLHDQASSLHSVTGDPLWGIASVLPVVGGKASAARTLGAAADSVATAAAPLAEILPHFSKAGLASAGGAIDVHALAQLGPVLTDLSAKSMQAAQDLGGIDLSAVSAGQASQITKATAQLASAAPTLDTAAKAIPTITSFLGAKSPRTYFLGLENLAEARGTGGFLGAYSILTTNAGKLRLERAASNNDFQGSPPIPLTGLPQDFNDLWQADATEWAGLNLSPHFPYTGQLVVNGWKNRTKQDLDGVIFLDQRVVAALIAATGPITVNGVTIDSNNAFEFLTKDIYAKFPDVSDKDAIVVQLVQQVFQRITTGEFSAPAMVKAMAGPISNGDLLMYSAHADEEAFLSPYSTAGILPDDAKPYSIVAVNNGAGNKLDAYVSITADYDGGSCIAGTRLSTIDVTLYNSAPSKGLPPYVTERNDLPKAEQSKAAPGSTKELLYVYGPVGSSNVLTTVDENIVAAPEGLERNHPVWRIDVVLQPGQTRTVSLQLQQTVDAQTPDTKIILGSQPMAIAQHHSVAEGTACTES